MCGHAFATNPFRRHETLQNGESPWIKSKTKPGPSKRKIDVFHHDRRQNHAESDKASCFNQLSESEAASASSLDVSAISKKDNGSEASRRKQCYRRATSMNEPSYRLFLILPLFIVRNECFVETTSRHFFLGLLLFSFLSFSPLLTTAKTCASLNTRCGTSSLVCFCFGRSTSLSFRFAHS